MYLLLFFFSTFVWNVLLACMYLSCCCLLDAVILLVSGNIAGKSSSYVAKSCSMSRSGPDELMWKFAEL